MKYITISDRQPTFELAKRIGERHEVTIDAVQQPYCSGTIVGVDKPGDRITIALDKRSPLPVVGNRSKVIVRRSRGIVPTKFSRVAAAAMSYKGSSRATISVLKRGFANDVQRGDQVTIPNRVPTAHALLIRGCRDCRFDVTVHRSWNIAVCAINCVDCVFNVTVEPLEDELLSSNGDGLQLIDCARCKVNAVVHRSGDDAVNIHGSALNPAHDRNCDIEAILRANGCYGGVKASGERIVIKYLGMTACAGLAHFGADQSWDADGKQIFDSGPLLKDGGVRVEQSDILLCGRSKADWPSLVYQRQMQPANPIVVANLQKRAGQVTGQPVALAS
jgi:hypothetical protein